MNLITVLIVVSNLFVREIIIAITVKVGFQTKSKKLAIETLVIFLCQFFNTGIDQLLFEANLKGQVPSLMDPFFNGMYSDFGHEWCIVVGDYIVVSMILNAILEPLLDCIFWGI